MRLSRQLGRMEATAAVREEERAPARVGVVWSGFDGRVEAGQLGPGEYIAVDVVLDPVDQVCSVQTMTERITLRPEDLGIVCDVGGARIGRVVAIDGDLVDYELTPVGEWLLDRQRAAKIAAFAAGLSQNAAAAKGDGEGEGHGKG